MAGKLEVEGKEILIKSSNGTMAVIPKDKVSMVKGYIDSGKHKMVDKFVGTLKEFKHDNQKAGDGLYANIHAKRQRIAAGSGERMRKPGEAGAPTAAQFKQAAKTAKAEYGMMMPAMSTMNSKMMSKQKAGDGKVIPPPVRKDLIRPDGTMKDVGFLGPLKSPSGKDVTEYSVGVPIMGKEMDIPTLVPGLSREEIAYVLQRADKSLPIGKDAMGNAIVQKAYQHATQRVKKGMSPFYSSVIDKAVPEMPADNTAVRPVKVPVIIPPKAKDGMMIAPMPKMNQKAKDGMCISSMSTMKQKAEDGVKIVPPVKRNPPVRNNAPLNKPTTADSTNVYDNALKVYDYFKNKKYKEVHNTDLINEGRDNAFTSLDALNNAYQQISKNRGNNITYRKNIDKNKFMQRENAYDLLDLNAPMQLFDRRIVPTKRVGFQNQDKNDILYGEAVNMLMYDPIAVKPISKMTLEEKLEREKKYPGSIPKTDLIPKPIPVKPKPILVKPKIDVPEELEPKNANYLLTDSEISNNRKPQMVSISKPAPKTPPALQYPAMNQSFLEKVKSFITGKKEMPYWTDKQGEKHYPHLGESNREAVKQIKMLKSGLNPLIPEDAKELRRIDMLLEMSSKDRLKKINQKAEYGMMIAPMSAMNQKAEDGVKMSSVNSYKAMQSARLPSKTKK